MRRLPHLLLATTLLSAGQVYAQPATLGRLFFTPEQRLALDRQRQQHQQVEHQVNTGTVTVNGLVRRSDGTVTTWVNGETLDNDGQAHKDIRVGQRLNQATGERQDLLKGGEIKVLPKRAR